MNYQRIYNQLIQYRIQNQILPTQPGHNHHIQPKRLFPKLIDDPTNIVRLTYREHFIAHLLYANICREQFGENSWQYRAMHHVVYRMQHSKKYSFKVNSRIYQKIENEHRLIGPWNKGKHGVQTSYRKGKKYGPLSQSTKNKLSAKLKGKSRKPLTDEIKKKISNTCKQYKLTDEQLANRKLAAQKQKGKPSGSTGCHWSNESKQKLSQTNKGKIHCTNGKENKFCFEEDMPIGWWKGQTNKKKSGPKPKNKELNTITPSTLET